MRGVVFGFLSILSLPTSALAVGYILHVGEYSFNLSQTKYTTPSLAFGVPNDGVWYAPLSSNEIPDTLKLKVADITYSICEPFVDTENYTYDENGRLIGANADLYLQSTGTQYIDTGFKPTNLTDLTLDFYANRANAPDIALISEKATPSASRPYSFGVIEKTTAPTTAMLIYDGYNQSPQYWSITTNRISGGGTGRYTLDIKHQVAKIGTLTHTFQEFDYKWRANYVLFARVDWDGVTIHTQYNNDVKIYSCRLSESDVLMRHFVPVPACMRIGDFVVPENGMWDIVNQQFYGNSGTGEFIYGKD